MKTISSKYPEQNLHESDDWTQFQTSRKLDPIVVVSFSFVTIFTLYTFYSFTMDSGNAEIRTLLRECSLKTFNQQYHSLHAYEAKIGRFETLTRIFGNYFRQRGSIISKAIYDDRLRNAVVDVLDSPSYELIKETIDADYTRSTTPAAIRSQIRNKVDRLVTESKTDEARKLETNSTEIEWLKQKFVELTGVTTDDYLRARTANRKPIENLNLWEYFSQLSQITKIQSLRKNMALDTDTEGNYVFTVADAGLIRRSKDGNYVVYDRLIEGPKFAELSNLVKVTVTTQLSIDRLHSLPESYMYWNGPISVAVLLNGPMEYFVLRSYLAFAKRCYSNLYEKTRFSVVTPSDDPIPPDVFIQTIDFDDYSCSSTNTTIVKKTLKKALEKTIDWLKNNLYPQNMMRNIARKNAITDYHITMDVDIMPCPKMSEGLHKFLSSDAIYTNALVVPTYEVSRKAQFPGTKNELVSLARKGAAQPFHKDVYLPNQNATNFPKWEKIHDSFEDVHIVYEITSFPIHYEPFFVELKSSPIYDEGFVGYGFTRSSHAYEMFLKNGNFSILSPIFTVQLGLQKAKEWSTFRQEQNELNRKKFDIFIKNLTARNVSMEDDQNKNEVRIEILT